MEETESEKDDKDAGLVDDSAKQSNADSEPGDESHEDSEDDTAYLGNSSLMNAVTLSKKNLRLRQDL